MADGPYALATLCLCMVRVWRSACSLLVSMPSSPSEIRLAASVAQQVRSALASILYSADFLEAEGGSMSLRVWQETLNEISEVTRRLQLTADCLLEHAGFGPAVAVPVSLRGVLAHTQALLHAFYRDSAYALRVELPADDVWLRGNPLMIEQALLQLVMATADCTATRCIVHASGGAGRVAIWIGADNRTLFELPVELGNVAGWAAGLGGELRLAGTDAPPTALLCLELPEALR